MANTYGAPAVTALMAASANPQFQQRMINVLDFGVSAFGLDGAPPTNSSSFWGSVVNYYYSNKK